MAKHGITTKVYEMQLAAARKAHGKGEQPNWLDRLKAVMKRRAGVGKAPDPR